MMPFRRETIPSMLRRRWNYKGVGRYIVTLTMLDRTRDWLGRHFDACADGRLLMLAPAAWPYQPGQKTMTRDDATAMNRLCRICIYSA